MLDTTKRLRHNGFHRIIYKGTWYTAYWDGDHFAFEHDDKLKVVPELVEVIVEKDGTFTMNDNEREHGRCLGDMVTFSDDGYVYVLGVGKIGMYANYDKELKLDYSLKFMIGTNESIKCERDEVKTKVVELFRDYLEIKYIRKK